MWTNQWINWRSIITVSALLGIASESSAPLQCTWLSSASGPSGSLSLHSTSALSIVIKVKSMREISVQEKPVPFDNNFWEYIITPLGYLDYNFTIKDCHLLLLHIFPSPSSLFSFRFPMSDDSPAASCCAGSCWLQATADCWYWLLAAREPRAGCYTLYSFSLSLVGTMLSVAGSSPHHPVDKQYNSYSSWRCNIRIL